jgi:hypothetical protein
MAIDSEVQRKLQSKANEEETFLQFIRHVFGKIPKDTIMIKEKMYKELNGKTVTVHVAEVENQAIVMLRDLENNIYVIDEFSKESEETNG